MTRARRAALPSPELYLEVRLFYAQQMHRLDGGDFAGFGATFTDDGVFQPAGGGQIGGPPAIAAAAGAAAARFNGGQPRHWFDMLTVAETGDGQVDTSYYASVTVTSPDGLTLLEPTCFVRDTLVRAADGGLRNRSRAIERDDLTARDRASAGQ